MTALAKDKQTVHAEADIEEFPVAASETIYKGALVMVVKGTGYAVSGADTLNGIVLGIAYAQADNSSGSDGDINVKVIRLKKVELVLASVAAADVGKIAYISDDQTVVLTGQTNNVVVGRVAGVKGTNTAWVNMEISNIDKEVILEDEEAIFPINYVDFLAADGADLVIAETAGDFYRYINTDVFSIVGEVANNETETSIGWFVAKLPDNYKSGGTLKLRLKNQLFGAGTSGASTLDLNVYKKDGEGATGADICATAAITPTKGAWQTSDFTVTPTGLVAGDQLTVKVTGVVVESATADLQIELDGIAVVCDVIG